MPAPFDLRRPTLAVLLLGLSAALIVTGLLYPSAVQVSTPLCFFLGFALARWG